MNEDILRTKYKSLEKKGVILLPFQKILILEKNKEFLKESFLNNIIDLDNKHLFFKSKITEDNFIKKSIKFFGAINYKDISYEDGELIFTFVFDLCQIRILKKHSIIKYEINVYWDV